MTKTCLRNPAYLLLALLVTFVAGCGAHSGGSAPLAADGAGKLQAKLTWGVSKSAAKTVALPSSVAKIRFTVTGSVTGSGAAFPTVRTEFPAATTSAQVAGLYEGDNLIVTAEAFDASGVPVFEGFATGVSVVANQTTDVGTILMTPPLVKTADKACVACHDLSRSVTGQGVVADFKQSGHYTSGSAFVAYTSKSKVGGVYMETGCAGCHGPSHNTGITADPSASGRCLDCHGTSLNPVHKNALTATGVRPAEYVASNYQKNCSACHEPHNPINGTGKDERSTWAQSAHGDVNGAAWATEDFQAAGQIACQRCHTATGFKNFVVGNFATPTPAASWAAAGDTAREVLACDACHSDDSFAVRPAVAFTAPYNGGKSPKTFPDTGTSTLCVACHSARESGDTIMALKGVKDFSNTGFVNSHYMGAAALMYMSNAFVGYTSQSTKVPTNTENIATYTYSATKTYATYNQPDNLSVPAYGVSGGTSSAHRRLGTPLIAGSETYLPAGGIAITTNGPCVTCHMQADNPVQGDSPVAVPAIRTGHGHSLQIDDQAAAQLCLPCHADAPHLDGGDGNGNPVTSTLASIADLQRVMLDPQSECFQNGLNLLKQILLVKYKISYNPDAYPYFYDLQKDATGNTAITDWTRAAVAGVTDAAVKAFGSSTITPIPAGGLNQTSAMRLMGACFNFNLMYKDPGSYVHARTFTQRLVYDALDFLDDNSMDYSALASARALNPAIYHGTNVNVRASNGTLGTESMIWMSGTHYSDPGAGTANVNTLLVPLKLHP